MIESLILASTQIPNRIDRITPKADVQNTLRTPHNPAVQAEKRRLNQLLLKLRSHRPDSIAPTEFSSATNRPKSGSQLYSQRVAALSAGLLYTRSPGNSFQSAWSNATQQPTYEQWRTLMEREAAIAASQPNTQRLGVLLGDSLSLWFPSDRLPKTHTWLNQSISGDTTRGILRRLSAFDKTHPHVIYLMAGINDLKNGATDNEILGNIHQIIAQLRQTQPQATLIVQSILPTRSVVASRDRIVQLNYQLRALVTRNKTYFLDLSAPMADAEGNLRQEFTTDGLHLTAKGYDAWQAVLLRAEVAIKSREGKKREARGKRN
jgi:lysophospholipase L1-like esterase